MADVVDGEGDADGDGGKASGDVVGMVDGETVGWAEHEANKSANVTMATMRP